MTATVTRIARNLTGTPVTYYDRDYNPANNATIHTYGPVTDEQVRAFAAQTHDTTPDRFDIYRPAAA